MSAIRSTLKKAKPVKPQGKTTQQNNNNNFHLPTPPRASSPATIKGVPGPIQKLYFTNRRGHPKILSNNEWFKASLFPPAHLMGMFRKSSPAMRMKYLYGTALFNDPAIPQRLKQRFNKSVDAMDYPHVRFDIRKLYRQLMWDCYAGVDGLYLFEIGLVPRTPAELDTVKGLMKKTMDKAKTIKWDKRTTDQWNKETNWRKVKSVLETAGIEVPQGLESLGKPVHSQHTTTHNTPTTNNPSTKPNARTPTSTPPKVKPDW